MHKVKRTKCAQSADLSALSLPPPFKGGRGSVHIVQTVCSHER